MTGFDIGIGWHNRRGCGGSWSGWAFSLVTQEALGELTPNHYKMVQLTILGFYFRSYLIGSIANIRSETEKGNEQISNRQNPSQTGNGRTRGMLGNRGRTALRASNYREVTQQWDN